MLAVRLRVVAQIDVERAARHALAAHGDALGDLVHVFRGQRGVYAVGSDADPGVVAAHRVLVLVHDRPCAADRHEARGQEHEGPHKGVQAAGAPPTTAEDHDDRAQHRHDGTDVDDQRLHLADERGAVVEHDCQNAGGGEDEAEEQQHDHGACALAACTPRFTRRGGHRHRGSGRLRGVCRGLLGGRSRAHRHGGLRIRLGRGRHGGRRCGLRVCLRPRLLLRIGGCRHRLRRYRPLRHDRLLCNRLCGCARLWHGVHRCATARVGVRLRRVWRARWRRRCDRRAEPAAAIVDKQVEHEHRQQQRHHVDAPVQTEAVVPVEADPEAEAAGDHDRQDHAHERPIPLPRDDLLKQDAVVELVGQQQPGDAIQQAAEPAEEHGDDHEDAHEGDVPPQFAGDGAAHAGNHAVVGAFHAAFTDPAEERGFGLGRGLRWLLRCGRSGGLCICRTTLPLWRRIVLWIAHGSITAGRQRETPRGTP